ncbi:MAG: type II toxin-antitoxin system prevent-host-death family antitoxin [Gammaproteobacteria bacterium]|nr:type II toxin-antitoxin system prevent-host-death family antitoxin [Gammaproteobacteria bacterium]MCY3687783.1 type II toxin-antitoxin system prevent-host-death family antitoxin [Gammaproteobacteria bacterium]MDE0508249.1 type II toxin-antitoxin system prevent-host-death family antitoxin [Gammaproteobacteria bacterium]MXX07499.1 type II toxin-antitoxin system Phd/YefM family antitoxin [Gammaproteobacteria bacterium]MXY90455.1 type II toxin-antitoxin system Phd/YefM family antitoxin [Gammapro
MKNVQVISVEEASMKTMAAAEFKARCLRVIKQMNSDREPVTITNRGRPVALLSPMRPADDDSPIGALRGSVLGFEDPFGPAADPSDWSASE